MSIVLDNTNIYGTAGTTKLQLYGDTGTTFGVTIDNSGYTTYKIPAWRVYNSSGGDQSTTDIIPCQSVANDPYSNYSTTTYKFTAPVGGVYFVGWSCYSDLASNVNYRTYIYVNGAVQQVTGAYGSFRGFGVLVYMAANDTCWVGSGAGYSTSWYGQNAHNHFYGHLVG